jgi:RimJ/RimL family protein N-acetyltransferase
MERSPPVSIPRLRTERLILREYRTADFEAFAEQLTNPEATRFIDTADRKTAWRVFSAQMGLWVLQGAGWWAVELRESGVVVGNVGAFFREGWHEIEIGWNTYRAFWGQGFATEAAREAVRHAFEDRGERRVTALIDEANLASLRVAEHLGMKHDANVELLGKPLGRWATSPRTI